MVIRKHEVGFFTECLKAFYHSASNPSNVRSQYDIMAPPILAEPFVRITREYRMRRSFLIE